MKFFAILISFIVSAVLAKEYTTAETESGLFLTNEGGVFVNGTSAIPLEFEEAALVGISRDTVLARAQDWVNRKIPYSQSKTTDGYRQDCSGMVSMAWQSSKPGHSTSTMQQICTKISRDAMKKGDALLKPGDHVLLFDHWVDSDHFMEYAEHQTGTVASHDQTSYSYHANQGFFPCRYNSIA